MRRVKEMIGYGKGIGKGMPFLGQGIGAAVLDTGIWQHPDFDRRIAGFLDCVNNRKEIYDDSGHGTHVAGILAGSGKMSNGMYAGMAPLARLYSVKVLDREGNGTVDNVIRGIQWVLSLYKEERIRIVNISVGTQPGLEKAEERRLLRAVENLWDAGLVVVVSAGNYGPAEGTVAVPGVSRKVITVGAADVGCPVEAGGRREWDYSGRGPTGNCIVKPDLVAPGTSITSCGGNFSLQSIRKELTSAGSAGWKNYGGRNKDNMNSAGRNSGNMNYGRMFGRGGPYAVKTGTSMATPVVSGAIACLLSKYPDMTNVEVKLKLRESCTKSERDDQGWGMLNMERLMKC